MLDLDSLNDEVVTKATGEPLLLDIKKVHEDPNQPRIEFNDESIINLSKKIADRGVKSPISVRPHPTIEGEWMINHGARRYRASIIAKKDTIPAFVDHQYDDYDQVSENEDRENLKPMELAVFINKKINEGEKKKVIASRLGLDAASITHHLALLELPDCLESLYRSGKTTSPKTLYELNKVYEDNPEHVEKWASTVEEVSRRDITFLKAQLVSIDVEKQQSPDSEVQEVEALSQTAEDQNLGHDQENDTVVSDPEPTPESKPKGDKEPKQEKEDTVSDLDNSSEPESEIEPEKPSKPKQSKTIEIKTPSIVVSYDSKDAVLILSYKPKSKDKVFIRFLSTKHGLEMLEVSPKELTIKSLSDSSVLYGDCFLFRKG